MGIKRETDSNEINIVDVICAQAEVCQFDFFFFLLPNYIIFPTLLTLQETMQFSAISCFSQWPRRLEEGSFWSPNLPHLRTVCNISNPFCSRDILKKIYNLISTRNISIDKFFWVLVSANISLDTIQRYYRIKWFSILWSCNILKNELKCKVSAYCYTPAPRVLHALSVI